MTKTNERKSYADRYFEKVEAREQMVKDLVADLEAEASQSGHNLNDWTPDRIIRFVLVRAGL